MIHDDDTVNIDPEAEAIYVVDDVLFTDGRIGKLEFYIDDNDEANIIMAYPYLENPRGYYFGEKLQKVVPEMEFNPATLDGEPINSFIHFGFWFCVVSNENCNRFDVIPITKGG
jgi:hypothetical protein